MAANLNSNTYRIHAKFERDSESGLYHAHCLEFDVEAWARDIKVVCHELMTVMVAHLDFCEKKSLSPYRKSQEDLKDLIESGQIAEVTIEASEIRDEREELVFNWQSHHTKGEIRCPVLA